MLTPLPSRFWTHVERIPPSTCWYWVGAASGSSLRKGGQSYGHMKVAGRMVKTSRLMHEAAIGPIPAGYHIDHSCHNSLCVNPAHLEAVTPKENSRRLVRRKRRLGPGGPSLRRRP